MAARAPQPAATGHPQQGVVLCNTPVVLNGVVTTTYCSQSMYHEGPHSPVNGLPTTWPKSIYNNK
jgi:hypothetical protein